MEDKELQRLFAFHMHRIKCAVFRVLNKKLVSMRLPVQMEQIPVLFTLFNSDLSQQEIANRTERDKSSIQRTVRLLEEKNLVVIQQDQFDKRKNIVHLTAEGKCVTGKIRKTLIEAEDEVFSAVEEKDREDFFRVLKRISDGTKE
ncbi:MarR family winged helix-turn-helix transcriptional regulator [Deminuibacter soli]|nr:MarR family transcriptional regulator [Deminuibacter soli]